jgi:hypothetical protein
LLSQQKNLVLVIAVILLILAAIGWISYRAAVEYPRGDTFTGIWSGLRGFLNEGLSPYSSEVQTRVSAVAAGWEATPTPGRSLFTYPIYILLPVLPVALIGEYTLARTLWIFLSIMPVIGLVLMSSRLAGWQPKTLSFLAALLFALINPYTAIAIISGNIALLSTLLVGLALLAIKSELDELAGLLLALSTIMPQLVLPLIVFVTLWAISLRRDRLLLWTYGGIGLLISGSWLAQRDWILGYIQALIDYYRLEGVFTPGQALRLWWPGFGAQMGWILTVGLGLLLLNEWRLAYGKGWRWFLWTGCLTLAIGPLLGLRMDPSSLAIGLLPLLFLTGLWDERWGGRFGWSTALILILLLLGLWALVPRSPEAIAYPGIYPVLYFALPIFTVFGLYWVRWLAVKPRGTVMDELRKRGEL